MHNRNKDINKKENLKTYLKSKLLRNSIKLKFKYPPISEVVNNSKEVLKIKKISNLGEQNKDVFLIEVKNYRKNPKLRYFLAILLANQSSDFLVVLAKNHANFNYKFKLVQYPTHPQFHRISLLCLNEIEDINQVTPSLQSLKDFKRLFRKKINNLKNI
jgi:hypothetical protein